MLTEWQIKDYTERLAYKLAGDFGIEDPDLDSYCEKLIRENADFDPFEDDEDIWQSDILYEAKQHYKI